MPTRMDFITVLPNTPDLTFEKDSVIGVTIQYTVPGKKGNSTTSFRFRIESSINISDISLITTGRITLGDYVLTVQTTANGIAQVVMTISPRNFVALIYDRIISEMIKLQSDGVIYRRIEISTTQFTNWVDFASDQTSPLTETLLARFPCTSGITGRQSRPPIPHKALAFLLYGLTGAGILNKPSRFLIQGVALDNINQISAMNSIEPIEAVFKEGITTPTGGAPGVTLKPVLKSGDVYREIGVIQLEGLSGLAGSRT